jgi:hypothetical protein
MEKIIKNFKTWTNLNEGVGAGIVAALDKFFAKTTTAKLASKLEATSLKQLDDVFGALAKNEINFIKNAEGALLLKSSTGITMPLSQFEKGLSAVVDGKMTPDEFAKLLPDQLADGTKFKTLIQNVSKGILSDIEAVATKLKFKPVTKQNLPYTYVAGGKPGTMKPFTYTKATTQQEVKTITADGFETKNIAQIDDIIFSGPSGENYVVTQAKLPKLYTGNVGDVIRPEQSARTVAQYSGTPITFKSPWEQSMTLKPGDYLVKDPSGTGYYRIAKKEYEQTYNALN